MASTISKIKSKVKSVVNTITSAGKKTNQTANASSAVSSSGFIGPVKTQTIAPTYQGPSINTSTGKSTYGGQTLAPVYQGPAINTRTGASNIGPSTQAPTVKKTGSSGGSSSKGSVLGASTSNLSADGTSLMNTRSFGPSSSSFSSVGGQTNLGSNASSVPTSSVVNTNTLGANNQKLTFAEPAPQDFSSLIPPAVAPLESDATKEKDTALQDYLKSLDDNIGDSADAYAKAQRETGILEKQRIVGDLTGQLNAIVNKGQANQLSLVGQGRGIPEAIIGGQQAQIGRETAIAALPIQAQLSAAQGNLEMANDNLDTLFKIYSDDARNKFEAKREQKKMVYEIASAKEKRELDKMDKLEERAYKEAQVVLEDIKGITKQALENGAPAGIMSKIANAKTYQEAISAAGKYGGDYLQRELLVQQINNVKSQIAERNNVANSYGTISGKPQNATQSSANGYADRVAEADVIISNLGTKFTNSTSIGGSLPNFLQNNDRQMYEQAKRNFITAILRRESGAAIADSEFITAEKQYFPQRGDGDGVVGQKEISRNTAINNLYRESGVNRPVLPGQIIESNGQRFKVGTDGETLELLP